MLLRRERPRAAVIEYEKGAKAVTSAGRGSGDARRRGSSREAGRTYLALGEPERALRRSSPCGWCSRTCPGRTSSRARPSSPRAAGEAIVELRAAIATNPFDPEVHCTLAAAYEKVPEGGRGRPPAEVIGREHQFCKELADGGN